MSVSQSANENSEQFKPAFARIKVSPRPGPVRYGPLGLRFQVTSRGSLALDLNETEEEMGRFAVILQAVGAMNAKGEPPAVGGDGSYSITKIASGAAEFTVTSERLVFLMNKAESVTGKVDIGRGGVLALVMPIVDVECVSVRRGTSMFGRVKERQTWIQQVSTTATIVIDGGIAIVEGGRVSSWKAVHSRVAEVIVNAAARARLAQEAVNDEERDVLERALRGERRQEGDETIAALRP
ncbi:MAG: hypothetical protein JWN00_3931 [Actinomycetia bacterium]|nr:hypothetical protein [Actinomycetes bacterium]